MSLEQANQERSVIYRQHLLWPYLVIPLSCILIIIDSQWLGGEWIEAVPPNPEMWFWWGLLFGYPHIVASVVTYADKEYLQHYRPQLWRAYWVVA